jgi:hypothetical protein
VDSRLDASSSRSNQRVEHDCGCEIKIKIKSRGDVHIHNCTCPEERGRKPGNGGCPPNGCSPGACLPVVAGAKHKKSSAQRLARIAASTSLPSTIASGVLQTCRRFMAGEGPANSLERDAFARLETTTPTMRDVLSCAIDGLDRLSADLKSRLFDTSLLSDLSQPTTAAALTSAWAEEVVARAAEQIFGDEEALEAEVPGQIRIFEPGDDVFPSPVRICRLNGLRTAQFRPSLDGGDYLPAEIQHICQVQVVDGSPQVTCEVQTEDCPGNVAAGACLRVPEIAAGDSVLLGGVNFFSTDTVVRLASHEPIETTRVVETHVRGDLVTPVTDEQSSLIMDCRVNDQLLFEVPADLPPAIYSVEVIVPNITGVEFWGESLSSGLEYIEVVPPSTARFTVTSETLHAEDETSPSWAGSDEVGLRFLAIAVLADGTPLASDPASVRLGNVDSGNTREITRALFTHQQPIAGLALAVLGHEVDSEDAYEKMITEWTDVFLGLVKDQIAAIGGALGFAGGLEALKKMPPKGWLLLGIAIAAVLAIDLIIALWAPADLIIDDAIGLDAVALGQLTSPDFPAPDDAQYTSAQGIDVQSQALEKLPTQYRELRKYHSDDEDSNYHLTLRFNRVA